MIRRSDSSDPTEEVDSTGPRPFFPSQPSLSFRTPIAAIEQYLAMPLYCPAILLKTDDDKLPMHFSSRCLISLDHMLPSESDLLRAWADRRCGKARPD